MDSKFNLEKVPHQQISPFPNLPTMEFCPQTRFIIAEEYSKSKKDYTILQA